MVRAACGSINTDIKVMLPIRPENISSIIIICDATLSDVVIPTLRPTVPIADNTSKNTAELDRAFSMAETASAATTDSER